MDMKIKIENGQVIYFGEDVYGIVKSPVSLKLWNGEQKDQPVIIEQCYDRVGKKEDMLIGICHVDGKEAGAFQLEDFYSKIDGKIILKRYFKVLQSGTMKGVRLYYSMALYPQEQTAFEQLRYFAPPAIFDKNDLDEDGYEDYFRTQKLLWREDRFNYPMFMAYHPEKLRAIRIERDILPNWDTIPERRVDPVTMEPDRYFLQKTDIGSLGIWGESDKNVCLKACYPFYEGEATIGMYIVKTVPFGAFWPAKDGESFEVSYKISGDAYEDFHDACWDSVRKVITEKKPGARALLADAETLVKYRLEALNRYYVEKPAKEDQNCPAGYVLNCHPGDGVQLENIIQYGFTGQNILNAYNVLRYGYENDNQEYQRRARRITDFFADTIHIPESGMFYNLYNVDMKRVNFWWTGLLLPLAYAEGTELSGLMGPLYEYRKDIIDRLAKLKGAYLRCMNEDVTALLRIYLLEKQHGQEHENWIAAVKNYCEFLLRTQEANGSWYRAYDLSGQPITEPQIWFGATIYEKKSSTATSIPLLVEMSDFSQDNRYLDAAIKAGRFVKEYMIDRVKYNGGVHDSIYAKGQLIDNESILYPMFGMLSLYEATKEEDFLDGTIKAAHMNASWVCLWNVPLPPESTLKKYGFNSIGMGACDTCGAGYVHPFQLMCVAETAKIAILTKDQELFEVARLYWLGCSQTVALPENDWGYQYYGLQEEGYLVSWWAVDDPMFSADTGFGHRLKGEGNKTCFPWINAVGVKACYSLMDMFSTTDFDEIYTKYFKTSEVAL